MKREILCEKCASNASPMHQEDIRNGFERRTVSLLVRKPAVHGLTVSDDKGTQFHPLRSLVCDHCDQPISDGTRAVAVTWWNMNRESEPGPWEEEYKYE